MLDYFEEQLVKKGKIDSRYRLEVRLAIGTAIIGDSIDDEWLKAPPPTTSALKEWVFNLPAEKVNNSEVSEQ